MELPAFIQTLIYGTVISFGMLIGLNGRILRRLAYVEFPVFGDLFWRPFSPNWLTAYSVLMLVALPLVAYGYPVLGIQIGLFWGLLDRLDGRSAFACGQTLSGPAKWQLDSHGILWMPVYDLKGKTILRDEPLRHPSPFRRWWFEMNFTGGTDLGGVLDPGMDKVKSLAILGFFSWQGLVDPRLLGLLAIAEIMGTLVRRPFYLFPSFQHGSRATWVGKYKAIAQWLTIIACVPVREGWILDDAILERAPTVITGLTWLSIALAYVSVVSRSSFLRRNKTVTEALDAVGECGLEHEAD